MLSENLGRDVHGLDSSWVVASFVILSGYMDVAYDSQLQVHWKKCQLIIKQKVNKVMIFNSFHRLFMGFQESLCATNLYIL